MNNNLFIFIKFVLFMIGIIEVVKKAHRVCLRYGSRREEHSHIEDGEGSDYCCISQYITTRLLKRRGIEVNLSDKFFSRKTGNCSRDYHRETIRNL